jgi:hypothetical protein
MNNILFEYLDNFYIAYLDNIIIYSENIKKHKLYIYKVLEKLQDTGFQVNIKKYKFLVTYIKYLSFIISIDSIKVNPEKIFTIKK